MCSGFKFHQCAHLQRGDPAGGICMWYAEAWIRSRSDLSFSSIPRTSKPVLPYSIIEVLILDFFCLAFGFGGGRGVGDIRAHPWLISGLASLVSPLFLFPQRFALITLRSGNLRGGNRKSEVERRVAPPMPACVALPLELMDIGTSVVGVLHLPVREASHCCKSIPIHAIGCRL